MGGTKSELAPGLLVAAPPLGDPNFERAVVLLAAHGEDGAFGWVINGTELMSMAELLERADFSEQVRQAPTGAVRAGGPVGSDQVWLLYPTDAKPSDLEDQFDLGCGVTASSSRRLLSALASGSAPSPIVGVAGYAGWGPKQLENEIRQGAWLPTDADSSLLFDCEPSELWLRSYERVGTSAIAFSTRVVGSA
jgi:putative transcriptional regulator